MTVPLGMDYIVVDTEWFLFLHEQGIISNPFLYAIRTPDICHPHTYCRHNKPLSSAHLPQGPKSRKQHNRYPLPAISMSGREDSRWIQASEQWLKRSLTQKQTQIQPAVDYMPILQYHRLLPRRLHHIRSPCIHHYLWQIQIHCIPAQ